MGKIKYGLIDKTGKVVLPFMYDDIFTTKDGLVVVQELYPKYKYGVFNSLNGEMREIIPLSSKYISFAIGGNEDLLPVQRLADGKCGYLDKISGEEIIPCKYNRAHSFHYGFAQVELNDKQGIIDMTGKEVVACKYERLTVTRFPLPAKLNGKWGIIDEKGNLIIDFKYDFWFIYGDQMTVELNGKWGIIDKKGNSIIDIKYDDRFSYKDQMSVKLNGKWGIIDKKGNSIIDIKYDDDFSYKDQMSVKLNGKQGLIDQSGNEILPFIYDEIVVLKNGIWLKLDGKWGLMDKETKQQVIPFIYEDSNWRVEDDWVWVKSDGKWGRINIKTKEKLIPCKYDYIKNYSVGLAVVGLNGKYGYVDENGNEVIRCKYDDASSFDKTNTARVKLGVKYGFIDKTGNIIAPIKYDDLGRGYSSVDGFAEGLAEVVIDKKHGYIDETGKEVIPCIYDKANRFKDNYAVVGVLNSESFNRIQEYRKALAANPNDMNTLYNLACCYHEMGEYQNSYDAVDKLVEQSPSANAWALRAQNCFLLGLNGLFPKDRAFAMGLQSCDRALALDNNCHNASLALVNIWGQVKYQGEKIIEKKSPDMEQTKQLIKILLQMEAMRPVQYTIVVDVVKLRMELQNISAQSAKRYDKKGEFSEGLAWVSKDNKYGYINKSNQEVIPLIYDGTNTFSEGYASVKVDGKRGFIDKTGKIVVPLIYDAVGYFKEGLAVVTLGGKWGFVNSLGKKVIPMQYDAAVGFKEGLAMVSKNKKIGYIDKTGKIAIPLQYDDASSFSEGLACVKEKSGLWGFINKEGVFVIQPKYSSVSSFEKQIASVNLETNPFKGTMKNLFLDKQGREYATKEEAQKAVDEK